MFKSLDMYTPAVDSKTEQGVRSLMATNRTFERAVLLSEFDESLVPETIAFIEVNDVAQAFDGVRDMKTRAAIETFWSAPLSTEVLRVPA